MMDAALADFHFLRPLWLLALLALPLFAWRARRERTEAGAWRKAVDPQLLPHLIERGDDAAGRGGTRLAGLVWILSCLALAGPAWERESMPLYRNESARVIVLELAASMLAQDIKPSRLERARHKIGDILDRSRDQQTALIGYAGDAFIAAPLTDDVNTVRNLVQALDPTVMPVAGNATGRAIARATDLIRQAGARSGEIIVIADSASADADSAARAALAQGMRVSVLAVGTAAGAPVALPDGGFLKGASGDIVVPKLEEDRLRALAAAGGGRYVALSADAGDLQTLLDDAPAVRGAASDTDDAARSTRFRDRGPWLLLLLLPIALAGFRRGWLMVLALGVGLPAQRADAASLADLWRRPDQQAAVALANGDAQAALERAHSPEWRGSAAFRAGDYQGAAQAWQQARGPDAAYNQGNALAKLGRYEEAIAAYDRALEQAPGMADAEANREAVEAWMKRQAEQPPPQQDGQNGQQGQDGQPSQSGGQSSPQNGSEGAQQGDGSEQGEQQDGKDDASSADGGQDGQQRSDRQRDDRSGEERPEDAAAQASAGQDPDQQAGQKEALSKAIDKALERGGDEQGDAAKSGSSAQQGQSRSLSPQEAADQEQQQAMKQWMERVPDDPGGLLRRKFLLEYQRRQQAGGNGP